MSALSSLALIALAAPAALMGASHLKTRKLAREARQLVPPVGQFCNTVQGKIHYIDIGPRDAQPLVLIHGLSGQLQHFTYALAELLAKDHRVIALDRPGCGYSTRASDALARLPEQAKTLLNVLDQLEVDPRSGCQETQCIRLCRGGLLVHLRGVAPVGSLGVDALRAGSAASAWSSTGSTGSAPATERWRERLVDDHSPTRPELLAQPHSQGLVHQRAEAHVRRVNDRRSRCSEVKFQGIAKHKL